MKDFDIIDYSNCITNLTSSIEAYYGLKPSNKPLDAVSNELYQKEYKNVLVVLFDAMGSEILEKNQLRDSFLLDNKIADFKSCFPPTTAVCTTCYRSGKNPITTGWLGWSSYVKEENITFETFTNKLTKTKEPLEGDWRSEKYFKYKSLGERIEKGNSEIRYVEFGPYGGKFETYENLKQTFKEMVQVCNEPGRKYFYCYFNQPDGTMHKEGTTSKQTQKHLKRITKMLEYFQKKTTDTIAFVSADHGMKDVVEIPFWKEQDLMNMMYAFPSGDARTSFFFIKPGMKTTFKNEFNKRFGQYYKLYTKKQVLEAGIFGPGKQHKLVNELLGDYVAIAVSDKYFSFDENHKHFMGHHAGILPEEMTIPLIVVKN